MIDPIQSLAFTPAVSVRVDAVSPTSAADNDPAANPDARQDAPAPPAAKPEAVSLSVDRDEMGVFVYTLTDSASGRILAVIPRSAVVVPSQTSEGVVDIQA